MNYAPIKVDLSNVWQKDFSKEPSFSSQSVIQPSENILKCLSTIENSVTTPQKKKKAQPKEKPLLKISHSDDNCYEIGIDEAGRGPMFGRLYVAGVVLPKDESFDASEIKDSKKYSSKKKIQEVYTHIKQNAIAYHVHYAEPATIDKINIRQAILNGMRECAKEIMSTLDKKEYKNTHKHKYFIMVDGDDFKPITQFNEETNTLESIPHDTFVGGDHTYVAIAAASILAKVERDNYILELCKTHPKLVERYGMDTHMGYGTKKHLDGIKEHGITQYHRKSYGCCKTATMNSV